MELMVRIGAHIAPQIKNVTWIAEVIGVSYLLRKTIADWNCNLKIKFKLFPWFSILMQEIVF